jgi:hypothetical protein
MKVIFQDNIPVSDFDNPVLDNDIALIDNHVPETD